MQNRLKLIKQLQSLGCKIQTTVSKLGIEDKVILPYKNIRSKRKGKFDPHPTILSFMSGTTDYQRLTCNVSGSSYGIKSVDDIARYYSYMIKTCEVDALVENVPILKNVNLYMDKLDCFCWSRGYIIVMTSVNSIKVVQHDKKSKADRHWKKFPFRRP